MKKVCCCTGHRPKGFTFRYGVDEQKHNAYLQALLQKIELAITEYGVTHFISGMAIGVDLDFAETVLKLREKYHLTLECAIPCPNQTLKWKNTDKLRYESILKCADKVSLISERYTPDCMLKRNRYIVDKSELVIAVFNGIEKGRTWYTINYARKTKAAVELIDLCGLTRKIDKYLDQIAAEDRAALLTEKDVKFLRSIGVETDLVTLRNECKKVKNNNQG